MFAIIKAKDKQYQVKEGARFVTEKIEAESTVEFDQILLLKKSDTETIVGTPTVPGAKVQCSVVKQFRGEKIIIFKKKRRKNYRKKQGHKQNYTLLQVDKISF